MTNPYDILFTPLRIGPVTAPNRFYQAPHCNGFGHRMPQGMAAMRGMKAEGGWGVVCTEETEIHHTSDLSPYFEGRIWSDDDIPTLALMTEAVHRHGALAGIELSYNGIDAPNLYSRAHRSRRVRWEQSAARAMTPCKPAAWTRKTFATFASGIATRRCAPNAPASISFIAMQVTA
jgi:2,4-dienoyl-CoA reductase-like NADH-dependent reductase (Old Yellow Enzyme family)